jgi:hypothetical protein
MFSQNKQILYGFSEIPQSLLLNPGGKVNNDWYFGLPLLSHIHVNASSSGVTVYDLFADNNVDFNTKLRNAVNGMSANDFFSMNEQLEIFSVGFNIGNKFQANKYLSLGMYQELDVIGYFPKDYAILALEGNYNNINKVFDVGDFNGRAELISVLHVGFNKKVNDNFSFGFRGKIYSSVLNLTSTSNKGSFYTRSGVNNYFDHFFNLDLEVQTSGLASLIEDDNSDFSKDIKSLRKRLLFGGNLGLGFDVGFSKQINKQVTVDASLLDIGFITHTKDVENYQIKGNMVFEGINPIFPETESNQTADEYWSEIEEDFEDLFEVDTLTTKYTTWRPVKLNASINYAFGEKKEKDCNCIKEDIGFLNAVGAQLYAIKRPKGPQLALTAYYYRRIFKGLQTKITYTIDSYSFNNIGLGMSANIRGFNLYLMVDNLWQYQNIYDAKSVSVQLGFNYIFKKNEK